MKSAEIFFNTEAQQFQENLMRDNNVVDTFMSISVTTFKDPEFPWFFSHGARIEII